MLNLLFLLYHHWCRNKSRIYKNDTNIIIRLSPNFVCFYSRKQNEIQDVTHRQRETKGVHEWRDDDSSIAFLMLDKQARLAWPQNSGRLTSRVHVGPSKSFLRKFFLSSQSEIKWDYWYIFRCPIPVSWYFSCALLNVVQ